MKNQNLARIVESFITTNLQRQLVPSVQGNTILMGNYKIKKKNMGYNIYPLGSNTPAYTVCTLVGAIALTKCLNKSFSHMCRQIIDYDKDLNKHETDLMFYQHTLKKSNNDILKDTVRTRADLAKIHKEKAKIKLEQFIYSA